MTYVTSRERCPSDIERPRHGRHAAHSRSRTDDASPAPASRRSSLHRAGNGPLPAAITGSVIPQAGSNVSRNSLVILTAAPDILPVRGNVALTASGLGRQMTEFWKAKPR